MAGRRTERMMHEKKETRKLHRELKERKETSMLDFSPLFGFIFPMWPVTTGGKQGKAEHGEKRHEREITHIPKNSEYLTSQKKTPWYYGRTDLSSSSACLWESADSIVSPPSSRSSLIFHFSTFDFLSDVSLLLYFQMKNFFPQMGITQQNLQVHTLNPLKLSWLTDICRFFPVDGSRERFQ